MNFTDNDWLLFSDDLHVPLVILQIHRLFIIVSTYNRVYIFFYPFEIILLFLFCYRYCFKYIFHVEMIPLHLLMCLIFSIYFFTYLYNFFIFFLFKLKMNIPIYLRLMPTDVMILLIILGDTVKPVLTSTYLIRPHSQGPEWSHHN